MYIVSSVKRSGVCCCCCQQREGGGKRSSVLVKQGRSVHVGGRRRRRKRESLLRRRSSEREEKGGRDMVMYGSTSSSRRLFSNLASTSGMKNGSGITLRHEPGSVLGAVSLVAGTTVGAGILALPSVTRSAGFVPSAAAIGGGWVFMAATGLLLAEVHLQTACELGSGGVSIFSIAERTLGRTGSRVASAAYLLIHYALLSAYISKSGTILSSATSGALGHGVASVGFVLFFGGICYFSGTKQLDAVNTSLLVAVLVSFALLIFAALPSVEVHNLTDAAQWAELPQSLPIIALSFVYHNVVPVVSTQLEGDVDKIRKAILGGTLIPLAMFLLWNTVILGSDAGAGRLSGSNFDPLQSLMQQSPAFVGPVIGIFSIVAIASSFVGFVLGLADFIADALGYRSQAKDPALYLIVLGIPLGVAVSYPDLFVALLSVAGTYGVLVLFGILPPLMAYTMRRERERDAKSGSLMPLEVPHLVPFGDWTLISLTFISVAIILTQALTGK